jgi:hypothetical protein
MSTPPDAKPLHHSLGPPQLQRPKAPATWSLETQLPCPFSTTLLLLYDSLDTLDVVDSIVHSFVITFRVSLKLDKAGIQKPGDFSSLEKLHRE